MPSAPGAGSEPPPLSAQAPASSSSGVPAHARHKLLGVVLGHLPGGAARDERRRRLAAERRQLDHLRAGRPRELAGQRGSRVRLRPQRADDRQRRPGQAAGDEPQQLERIGIRPVQVVERQQQRPILGQARQPAKGAKQTRRLATEARELGGVLERATAEPGDRLLHQAERQT